MKIKKLDLTQDKFIANGQQYHILESVPLGRYIMFLKESPKLSYGVTFKEIFKNINRAYNLMNAGQKYGDVSVILHNIMKGIAEVENENRHDSALRICALFIVRDGEDLSTITEEQINKKIEDWSKEGYEINGFFHLALFSIEEFTKTFEEFTLGSQK